MPPWLLPNLPVIAMKSARIFCVAAVFELLVFFLGKRVDAYLKPLLAQDAGRDPAYRLRRRNKLRGVAKGTVRVLLYTVALLMILGFFDVPMYPVYFGLAALVGVGVLALRPLLQDLCAGYVILAEDEFAPGDPVKIGDFAGTVETMSLRQTTLRDAQNPEAVHVLANREITRLTVKRPRRDVGGKSE